jgi:hypothetical protein
MSTITVTDKFQCIVRELGYRKMVYPRQVEKGKMSQSQADREIAVMEAIAYDYKMSSAQREMFSGDDAA